MKNCKILAASLVITAFLAPLSAGAVQTIQVGTSVGGPQGGVVGTVTAVGQDYIVVRTNEHSARLPASSFTVTEEAVLFALTQQQLNQQIEQAMAQAQEAIVVGAIIHDRNGNPIGPVDAVEGENVTVKLGEQSILLNRSSIAPGQAGLRIALTIEQLRAQIAPTPMGDANDSPNSDAE